MEAPSIIYEVSTCLDGPRERSAPLNGKFRDECLNEHWFLTLQEAQLVIEAWRREYNEERPHSAIGNLTPMEFINHHHNQPQTA